MAQILIATPGNSQTKKILRLGRGGRVPNENGHLLGKEQERSLYIAADSIA